MMSRPIWGWFKPRVVLSMVLASQWMGLVPEFRYLMANWLTRLSVSERAALEAFCICTTDITSHGHIMGCMRATYLFKEFV